VNTIKNENSPNSNNINGNNNTITNNYPANINENPNIKATLIIDSIGDSTFTYYYKIENTGNATANNVTYCASTDDFYDKENESYLPRQLNPNDVLKCDVPDWPSLSKVENISFYLIVKYTDNHNRYKNCLYRYFISKNQLKLKRETDPETKNCVDTILTQEREQILLKNAHIKVPLDTVIKEIFKSLYLNSCYKQGLNYSKKGSYDTAIFYFNKVIEIYQQDTIYYNRGVANLYNGKIDSALNDFTKAITLNPHYVEAYRGRCITYEIKGLNYDAINDYTKIIEINPKNDEFYCDRGIAFYNMNLFNTAILDFSKAININSKYDNAYYYRGQSYEKIGLILNAIEDYKKTIEINPRSAESYMDCGDIYLKKGLYDSAFYDYCKVIEIDSGIARAYHNRGIIYFNKRLYDKAIIDFNKTIKLNSQHSDTYFNLGVIYARKGSYSEAIINYSTAIKLDPKNAVTYFNLAGIYYYLAFYNNELYYEAIKDFSSAIEIRPDYKDAYKYRGYAFNALGKSEEAKKDFEKCEQLKK